MQDELLKNIPENIDAGVFVLDQTGTVVYVNSAAVQLIGRPKGEILGINTTEAFQTGLIDTHIFQEVLRTKRAVTLCESFLRPDSTYTIPLLITQTPVLDKNFEVRYSVGIIRDMEHLNQAFQQARRKAVGTMSTASPVGQPNTFVYASDAMKSLLHHADLLAESGASILIQGESGTGKEVMAQYIHSKSPRREKELVAINCAALPENLLEAELFGYEKGAFTGALREGKPGLAELADKGTLFLDEIDSLPLNMQGKLLRLLESHEVRRVGGTKTKRVDFQLIAATNADLLDRIQKKAFRADLYYRINVVPIVIPPLRQRKEDILPLCEAFLSRYEQKYGRRKSFSPKAYRVITEYDWPGNVRELKNFVERMVLITDVTETEIDHITPEALADISAYSTLPFQSALSGSRPAPPAGDEFFQADYKADQPLKPAVHEYEQWLLRQAIQTHGSYSKAAAALGIDKSTLIRKLR